MSAPLRSALIGFLLSAVFLANRWKVPGGFVFGSIEHENRSALVTEHVTEAGALQKDTEDASVIWWRFLLKPFLNYLNIDYIHCLVLSHCLPFLIFLVSSNLFRSNLHLGTQEAGTSSSFQPSSAEPMCFLHNVRPCKQGEGIGGLFRRMEWILAIAAKFGCSYVCNVDDWPTGVEKNRMPKKSMVKQGWNNGETMVKQWWVA